MTTLIKRNPYREHIGGRCQTPTYNRSTPSYTYVPFNILKDLRGYTLEIAKPGASKSDFKIVLEKDILKVSYTSVAKESKKGEKCHRCEIKNKNFTKEFYLSSSIDIEQISAGYEDGVLKIELPFLDKEASENQVSTIEIN